MKQYISSKVMNRANLGLGLGLHFAIEQKHNNTIRKT